MKTFPLKEEKCQINFVEGKSSHATSFNASKTIKIEKSRQLSGS